MREESLAILTTLLRELNAEAALPSQRKNLYARSFVL